MFGPQQNTEKCLHHFKQMSRHLLAERLFRTSLFTEWEFHALSFVRPPRVSPMQGGRQPGELGPRPGRVLTQSRNSRETDTGSAPCWVRALLTPSWCTSQPPQGACLPRFTDEDSKLGVGPYPASVGAPRVPQGATRQQPTRVHVPSSLSPNRTWWVHTRCPRVLYMYSPQDGLEGPAGGQRGSTLTVLIAVTSWAPHQPPSHRQPPQRPPLQAVTLSVPGKPASQAVTNGAQGPCEPLPMPRTWMECPCHLWAGSPPQLQDEMTPVSFSCPRQGWWGEPANWG